LMIGDRGASLQKRSRTAAPTVSSNTLGRCEKVSPVASEAMAAAKLKIKIRIKPVADIELGRLSMNGIAECTDFILGLAINNPMLEVV